MRADRGRTNSRVRHPASIALAVLLVVALPAGAATVTKTWAFLSNSETFTATVGNNSAAAWDSANGNPAGALSTTISGRSKSNSNYWEWTGTFEAMGVPAGSVVTAVQLTGGFTRCLTYTTGAQSTAGPWELRDSAGTTVLATLYTGRTFTAVDGTWVAATGSLVSLSNLSSNTTVKVRLNNTLATGNSGSAAVNLDDDQVALTITYTTPTTTVGPGVAGSSGPVCPLDAARKLDGFSLQSSADGLSITGLTVTTTGTAAIASLQIWNEAGTQQYYTTVSSPSGNNWSFSGGTAITSGTTLANYKVFATYKDHATAPAGSTATTAVVSAITGGGTVTYNDTADTTLTLDNVTPTVGATWGTNTPGDAQVTLNWTYGTAGENVVIVRYTANTDTTLPTDGTTYIVGNGYGVGGTVRYVGNGVSPQNWVDNVGLSNGTTYYYRIFEYDSCLNYVATQGTAPWSAGLTPAAATATTIGNGSPLASVSSPQCPPVSAGGAGFFTDAFDLSVTGGSADTVTSVTVRLNTGISTSIESVYITDAANAPQGARQTTPSGDDWTIGGLTLNAPTGTPTQWRIWVVPKTTTAMPSGSPSVNAKVQSVLHSLTNNVVNNDTADTTYTVDNTPATAATWGTNTASDSSITLNWTYGTAGDTVLIVRYTANTDTTMPTDGTTYSVGSAFGTGGTVRYVGSAASPWTDTVGLVNGTNYYYRIFEYDACVNYAATAPWTAALTPGGTTTVGNGLTAEPSAATRCPGDPIADLDNFTLVTTSGSDTVNAVTVTLSPAGAFGNISLISITNDAGGTTYGSISNPSSNTVVFSPLSTNISVTTTETQYHVRITPKTHPNMAAVPGASYATRGLVTAVGHTSPNNIAYADTTSGTLTVDNLSPSNATWGTITPGSGQITLNWTNPAVADFSEVVILRDTYNIDAVLTEGMSYAQGNPIGSAVVRYVGSLQTFNDTGLTAGTYFYKIFAKDSCGNYAAGVASDPIQTISNAVNTLTPYAAVDGCTQVTVTAPYTGDANGNSTTAVKRGASGAGPFSSIGCDTLSGASPRKCVDTTAVASQTYYYQVDFTDVTDGVTGSDPQVIGPYGTPACSTNGTTAGTASAMVSGSAQFTVTAPFTGDSNGNGYVLVEYNTTNSWPGTTACAAVGGSSPRVCLVTGLNASTAYYVRVTYNDADGVTGSSPQLLPGTYTTTALVGGGGSPMIMFLTPARDAVVGGTSTTFQVQVYGPDAIAAGNVLWGLDGASPTNAVTANNNYSCNIGSQTNCKVYEFTVNASTLSAGPHYVTVKATDSKATPAVGQASRPFQVKNVGTAPRGSGNLLRRTQSSQLCTDCHSLPTHSSQATSFKYGSWAMDCQTCHTPHSTANIYLIRSGIQTPNSGPKSVDFRNTTGVAQYSFGTPQASGNGVNVCEVCHTKTKNSDSTARARNNSPTDWTKHYTGDCRSCHKHEAGFVGGGESGGNDDCLGCHKFAMDIGDSARTQTYHHVMETGNIRVANITSYPTSSTPTVSTATVDKACTQCHADHNVFRPDINTSNNLGVGANLRTRVQNGPPTGSPPAPSSPGDAAPGYYSNKDTDGSFTYGGICLSCHVNGQTKNTADQKTYTGDPGQTSPIVAAAGDFSASAHAFTVGGQFAKGPSAFTTVCAKCHSDPTSSYQDGTYKFVLHTSANRRMLNPLGITAPGDPLAQNFCFRCHSRTTDTSPGGGPAKTVANRDYYDQADMSPGSQLLFNEFTAASTSKHPVTAAGAGALHDPVEGTVALDGSLSGSNRHIQCEDCHSPHSALRPGDTGTATGSTPTSLTDSAKSGKWLANQWSGYKLMITSGTGAGQTQNITGNTTTGTLNVASWNVAAGTPVSGSGYRISRQGDNAVSGATRGVRGVTVTSGTVYHVGSATFKDGTTTVYSGASGGIVTTASTGTTVTSAIMNWTTNQWSGYVMRVVVGGQAGQVRNITANAQTTLTISAAITLAQGDLFVIARSTGTDVPVWSSAMVGGHIRNELDRDGRWYRITAITTVDATNRVYSATITPGYGSGAFASGSALSDTRMTAYTTAPTSQWYMDYGTLYSISSVTFAATTSATKEHEICLKCHSSWALDFGSSNTATGGPPNVPSGHQDGGAVAETNVALDFNTGQLSYHPVFAPGLNQPTGVTYTGWNPNAAYTRVDNTGNSSTFGLSNTFTTGWYKESLLQCSDCHASDTPSDPLGPHASGKKWILRGLDTTVSWVRRNSTGTGWETITNNQVPSTPATEAKNFCLNCHRWDVYGYIGLGGNAPASVLSRVAHDVSGNNNTYNAGGLPRSGIVCNNCHGGDRIGGAHGSSRRKFPFMWDPSPDLNRQNAITAVPASYSGKRLLNGAYWYGVTRATTSTAVACWGKGGTDTVSLCAHGHENTGGNTAQYSYDDAADP